MLLELAVSGRGVVVGFGFILRVVDEDGFVGGGSAGGVEVGWVQV